MVRKITNFVLILTLILFVSCRTIKEVDFKVDNSIGTILPPLQGVVDLNNLQEKISLGYIRISGYYNGVVKVKVDGDSTKMFFIDKNLSLHNKTSANPSSIRVVIEDDNFNVKDYRMNPDKYYTKAEFIPDKRVEDFIKLLGKEMKNSVAYTDSVFYGTIHFELISFHERKNPLLTLFSLLTLCVPTLIGVPLTCITTSLEIQVTIYNKKNEFVGEYNGIGEGSACIAMYWGYGNDATRKSALLALKDALNDVKSKIRKHKSQIISRLMK